MVLRDHLPVAVGEVCLDGRVVAGDVLGDRHRHEVDEVLPVPDEDHLQGPAVPVGALEIGAPALGPGRRLVRLADELLVGRLDRRAIVTVFWVVDGQERQISEPIDVGGVATIENYTSKGACFDTGSLLAKDPSGRVVARLDPGPLCPNQSWDIGPRPSASP